MELDLGIVEIKDETKVKAGTMCKGGCISCVSGMNSNGTPD